MAKNIQAGHPYHRNVKGKVGGSLPAVYNDHVKACTVTLNQAQAKVTQLKDKFPNPVNRLKK